MGELQHREVTGEVLRAYYEVWNHTARLYPEQVYERCMELELDTGLPQSRQPRYDIFYKEWKVGQQELDLFVAGEVVVELKVVEEVTKLHKAQAISYLKVVGKEDGLLLNFGGRRPVFTRLFYHPPEQPMAPGTIRRISDGSGWYRPDLTYEIQAAFFEVYNHLGPGFVHRIYANACYRELQLRGLPVQAHRALPVQYKGQPVGEIPFRYLQIDEILLFPVATTRPTDLPLHIIKSILSTTGSPLALLANFQDDRLEPTVIRPTPA